MGFGVGFEALVAWLLGCSCWMGGVLGLLGEVQVLGKRTMGCKCLMGFMNWDGVFSGGRELLL